MAAEPKRAAKAAPKPITDDHENELEGDLRSAVGNARMGRLIDPSLTSTIETQLGGGKPLAATPGAQRSPGGDGEEVRIHDDGTAAELSRELGAVAFTYGRDIFLAGDAPDLTSGDGQAMLRHELTHVDQQAASGTTRPRRVSSPESPAEQQASRAAAGASASPATGNTNTVHRQEEEEMLQTMPADTVHRQEEEEEEEEEMLQTMPADTVHRQEEEELMMMPADTVHRQEEEAGTAEDTVAPANPALAALFEATVLAKHRAAIASLEQTPPDAASADGATVDAWRAVVALSATYETSDPLLFAQLRRYMNAINIAHQQLFAIISGPRGPDAPHQVLTHEHVLGLAEQLRGQLH